jgi:hypothetical protein
LRESGQERDARVDAGIELLLGDGFLELIELALLPVVGVHHREVRVRVDEAGEQRGVAEIDDLSASGYGRAGTGGGDFIVGDDDEAGSRERIAFAVEHARGLEDDGFAGSLLRLLGIGGARDCSRCKSCCDDCSEWPFANHEFSSALKVRTDNSLATGKVKN